MLLLEVLLEHGPVDKVGNERVEGGLQVHGHPHRLRLPEVTHAPFGRGGSSLCVRGIAPRLPLLLLRGLLLGILLGLRHETTPRRGKLRSQRHAAGGDGREHARTSDFFDAKVGTHHTAHNTLTFSLRGQESIPTLTIPTLLVFGAVDWATHVLENASWVCAGLCLLHVHVASRRL